MPIPRMVIPVPGRSSFFIVSSFNFCFGIVSPGTVKYAIIVTQKYTMARKKNQALQLKICVNSPARMVPKTKPSGLPAENAPNDLFFRGLGFSYMVPSMPWAGGTAAADQIPRTPQRISRVMPDWEKPAPRLKMLNRSIDTMNMLFRPKRSAMLPKNKSNEPAVNLFTSLAGLTHVQLQTTVVTYDEAAFIHVISALVMPRSFPAKELMTVIEPVKKLDMATAIVTDMTNKHSCSVDLKHSGRALGSLSLIGGETSLPSAAPFSGSSVAIL
jgi:hypothetical protein